MANRNQVAKLAGVSGATVSRVFNNPDSVAPKTREKVLAAAKQLDYHPNITAGNFVRGVAGNIGVVIPYIPKVHIFSAYYFSELLSGIGEILAGERIGLMLFFHDGTNGKEYDKYFQDGRVDGCILLGTYRDEEQILRIYEKGRRFCLVNNYFKGKDISYIDADNVEGSYKAVKHLVDLGHERIAFLNGPEHFVNSVDRLAGYKKVLKEHGLALRKEYMLKGNYGWKSGYAAGLAVLEMEKTPSAVFAANDRMAAGLIQALKENGKRVPDDVSVVGYDDADIATIVEPALTTVRVPFYEMGRICAQKFIEVLKGRINRFQDRVGTELVIRSSCRGANQN